MALTAKTDSSDRGTGQLAQIRRGDGNTEPGAMDGANRGQYYAVAEYDFSKDGALASGAIWGSGVYVPKDAVVTRAGLYTETLVAGPSNIGCTLYGATVAATASADFNLVADAAVTTTQGTSTIGVPVPATASTWVHTGDAAREINFDFSSTTPAATTAGRVMVWVEYFLLGDQATPVA